MPIAVLDDLKAAALDAGMPRLALVGGVVRDWLLHRRHGRPWAGVPDLDWVVEGEAARLASALQCRFGSQRVTAVQEHGAVLDAITIPMSPEAPVSDVVARGAQRLTA